MSKEGSILGEVILNVDCGTGFVSWDLRDGLIWYLVLETLKVGEGLDIKADLEDVALKFIVLVGVLAGSIPVSFFMRLEILLNFLVLDIVWSIIPIADFKGIVSDLPFMD